MARIRFWLDPNLSDKENAERIMRLVEEARAAEQAETDQLSSPSVVTELDEATDQSKEQGPEEDDVD
jgi:hypothetical protein